MAPAGEPAVAVTATIVGPAPAPPVRAFFPARGVSPDAARWAAAAARPAVVVARGLRAPEREGGAFVALSPGEAVVVVVVAGSAPASAAAA